MAARWLDVHSVSVGPDTCIIYCHIGQVYEWQQRYDQWWGRINQFSKGYWQGLEEGFIMTDFIDVLQSCVCVCVCGCRNGGSTPGRWCRKSAACVNRKAWMSLCLLRLLLCVCCSSPVLLRSELSRQYWQQVTFACFTCLLGLAMIPVSHKCDSNFYAAFVLENLTSGGFMELKKGIEGRTIHWASYGPVPLRIT